MGRKLLTRNTFAKNQNLSMSNTQDIAISKADILNLASSDTDAVADLGLTITSLVHKQLLMILGISYIWFLLGEFSSTLSEGHQTPLTLLFHFVCLLL